MAKDFYCVGVGGDFGRDPGLALGLLDEQPKLFEGVNPNRPEREEVLRIYDEDDVVNIGKDLDDVLGVSVGEGECCLVEEVVDGGTQMCAENSSGKALALENTLRDIEM